MFVFSEYVRCPSCKTQYPGNYGVCPKCSAKNPER